MERAPRGIVKAPQRVSKPAPVRHSGNGPPCPENPAHGPLLLLDAGVYYYCPHHDHDGRVRTHPEGASPPTKRFWTEGELS